MNIWTRITLDIETGEVLSREGYDWDGPVAWAKGQGKAEDELKQQRALQEKALAEQRKFTGPVYESLIKYLQKDLGFTPEQTNLLVSRFLSESDRGYSDAAKNVKLALARRGQGGGDTPVSGNFVRQVASLEGARASDVAGGLRDIRLADIQTALANRFNAARIFTGNAGVEQANVGVFGSGRENALSNYIKGANIGFWPSFTSAFGEGLAGLATGGIGGGLKKLGVPGMPSGGGN